MPGEEAPWVLPGQPLALPAQGRVQAGPGTYPQGEYIVASRVGHVQENWSDAARRRSGAEPVAQVVGTKPPLVMPGAGSVVRAYTNQIIGRVTRVTPRQATVSILVVDGIPCGGALGQGAGARGNHAAGEGIDGTDFQGIVRAQDVRSTEKDSVVLKDCFRPGDIIRASVISLGDARSYYLSTAENQYGVVHAMSSDNSDAVYAGWGPSGRAMQPISWKEMADPVTGHVEPRKCAKPEWV